MQARLSRAVLNPTTLLGTYRTLSRFYPPFYILFFRITSVLRSNRNTLVPFKRGFGRDGHFLYLNQPWTFHQFFHQPICTSLSCLSPSTICWHPAVNVIAICTFNISAWKIICSFQASKLNYTSYFNSQGIWFQFERLYVWMIMSFSPKEDLNMEKDFRCLI